jgi:pimeloyl-ACP methyl ester carboxylesterase
VNLTLTAVFHARTIEGLARLVESGKKWLRPYSLIHPYRTEGDRPPLFSYGGSEELGRCLGPGQPIYWLQEVGMNGRPWPDSIEEMAAKYLGEMRLVQPHGPYFLAGYSFGGLVMFELAHQLLKQGERVALLVLIDPSPPNDEVSRKAFTSPGPLRGLCAEFLYHCRNLARLRFREKLGYIAVRLGWRIRRLICDACFCLGYRLPAFVRPFYFFELTDNSIERYVPPIYPRSFILFRHADRGTAAQWRSLAVGELEIHEVPSSVGHGQILKEPFVHILADKLKTYLRDAHAAFLASSR